MYQKNKSNQMSIKSFFLVFVSVLFIASFSACTDDDTADDSANGANQTALLENSSEIIEASYKNAKSNSSELKMKAEVLESNLSLSSIQELKASLKSSWIAWQKISFYEFGKADELGLKSSVNIYKTDTVKIEDNIRTANFNLDQLSMKNAKGFPGLDYLLNSESENDLLIALQNDSNRRKYILQACADINSRFIEVSDSWENSKSSFIENTGTDVGSSLGMLINALNLHYEKFFRDNKLGIPLGVRSAGIPRPDFCEAVYGEYSVELAQENFEAFKNFYSGITSDDSDGYGLDDYLKDANAAELNNRILAQISLIDLKLNALSDPLPQQIQNNAQAVQEAYNEIQRLIVLLKVDLPSRIGVLITYQDNDGD